MSEERVAVAADDVGSTRQALFHDDILPPSFELQEDVQAAGFRTQKLLGVEGPGWTMLNFDEV